MLVAITSAAVIIGGGISVALLFRRTTPLLTDDDLSEAARSNHLHIGTKLNEQERTEVKKAFMAGPDFKWIVSGNIDGKIDNKNETLQKNHHDTTFYMLECVLTFAEKYGHIIVARNPHTNEFLGSLCLIPPYKYKWLSSFHFIHSVLPLGIPPFYRMGPGPKARFEAFIDMTDDQHQRSMKDTPQHWYIVNLGISENAQGKGVGTKLLNAAFDLSKSTQQPLYLECHDENVAYYEKRGFTVKNKYFMTPKGIENPTSFPFNGMVREI